MKLKLNNELIDFDSFIDNQKTINTSIPYMFKVKYIEGNLFFNKSDIYGTNISFPIKEGYASENLTKNNKYAFEAKGECVFDVHFYQNDIHVL